MQGGQSESRGGGLCQTSSGCIRVWGRTLCPGLRRQLASVPWFWKPHCLARDLPFVSGAVGGSRSLVKPVCEGWMKGRIIRPTASGGLSPVVTQELAEAGCGSPQQAPTLLASSLLSFRLCRWLPRLCTLVPGRLIRSTADPSMPRGRSKASQQSGCFYLFFSLLSIPKSHTPPTIFDSPSRFSAGLSCLVVRGQEP